MDSTIVENSTIKAYKVVLVEQIETPEGMTGAWHRYVIQRGESKIEGLHAGELNAATEHAESFADSLNERLSKKVVAYGSQRKK